jgi:hypothetical protein
VERPIFVDKVENPLHQGVLFEVGENTKGDTVAAQVRIIVRIAARAAERALPRNFDG